jgi:acetoacetyl-CoA synthetase
MSKDSPFCNILFQYTHSGKKVEVAIKKILAGEDVKARGSYCNPDSLDLYYNLPQLQGY